MTRAALLPLLVAPESLSAAAVQDLEQLAQAFPYCQTAHLLLAKAAHDQGSMLVSQRVRRAATYAADRQLLRQLLELPPITPIITSATEEPVLAETVISQLVVEPAQSELDNVVFDVLIAEESIVVAPADAVVEPEPVLAFAEELVAVEVDSEPQLDLAAQRSTIDAIVAEQVSVLNPEVFGTEEVADNEVNDSVVEVPEFDSGEQTSTLEESEVPPLPIQPSVEAGTARFEFGLSPNLEAGFSAYQLTELPVEAVTADAVVQPPAAAGPAPYTGTADLGYALGGGSRLGYAIEFLPTEEGLDNSSAAWAMPASVLPPAGDFFEPDALVLEHVANQPPPAPPAPSSGELIESFLRRTPQRRRGIVTLLTVPEQADLSMRSTRTEPDLASESLARILAGQGKIDRAISVYERLMVRQPEKSTYFAVQIELLRNPPTPSS